MGGQWRKFCEKVLKNFDRIYANEASPLLLRYCATEEDIFDIMENAPSAHNFTLSAFVIHFFFNKYTKLFAELNILKFFYDFKGYIQIFVDVLLHYKTKQEFVFCIDNAKAQKCPVEMERQDHQKKCS